MYFLFLIVIFILLIISIILFLFLLYYLYFIFICYLSFVSFLLFAFLFVFVAFWHPFGYAAMQPCAWAKQPLPAAFQSPHCQTPLPPLDIRGALRPHDQVHRQLQYGAAHGPPTRPPPGRVGGPI